MSRIVLGAAALAGVAGLAYAISQHLQTRNRQDDSTSSSAKANKMMNNVAAAVASNFSSATSSAATSSSSSSSSSTTLSGTLASASSKVLLTGGYLILERDYPGLVLALSARFRTEIFSLPDERLFAQLGLQTGAKDDSLCVPVIVYAPQRSTIPLRFRLSYQSDGAKFTLTRTQQQEVNRFVELTLLYSLLYISNATSLADVRSKIQSGLLIYLEGDFPFYSAVPFTSTDASVPPVVPDGSKTGLGSSAALVTSLVAALFTHFRGSSSSPSAKGGPNVEHSVAQFVHCAAQGKVGSGFDVSTAFFGSQVYQRFDKEVIQPLVEQASKVDAGDSISTTIAPSTLLTSMSSSSWNHSVSSFSLPPGLSLVLADVAGGASTPAMVKLVLKWRENRRESETVWESLAKANGKVRALFDQLSSMATAHMDEYHRTRLILAAHPAHKWESLPPLSVHVPTRELFLRLHKEFDSVRHWLRQLGSATSANIEPRSQGQLCDETTREKGVLLAGVPGAGGDDAIFAILLDESIVPTLEARWADAEWLPAAFKEQGRKVRRLPVHEERRQIIREETKRDISKWKLQ